jgi:Zn-dependent protease
VLSFSLGDIPVKVHLSFLLIAIVFPQRRLVDYVAWVLVAFLAVLLHEAGHAFAARAYGASQVTITLFALGGVTVYPLTTAMTPARRLVISAMGSIVGIVTGGLVGLLWLRGVFDGADTVIRVAAIGFIWASLGWGILNWIPIRPLDGGAMLTSFLEIIWPSRALQVARIVSIVFGVGAAILLWRWGQTFGAVFILFIMMMGLSGGGDDSGRERSRQRRPKPPERKPEVVEQRDDPPDFPI